MNAITLRIITILLAALLSATTAHAQAPSLPRNSPFAGGIPSGTATAAPIRLTIIDAVTRALAHNLGVLLAEQQTATAAGDRWIALSRLLPNLNGSVTDSRRKTNLEAFGFPLGPTFPKVVGPFNVFDARVFVSQALLDVDASHAASAAGHRLAATQHTYRGAREIVLLASANTYLEALAAEARSVAAQAQLTSSNAIHQQAIDLKQSGIIAGLDVVRAEVRVSADRQRATAAANDAQIAKLRLARLIGLPIGQEFTIVDNIPLVPAPPMSLQAAIEWAYANRSDYQAALEELKAAADLRAAAVGGRLPSIRVLADYGAIGLTPGSAIPTFNVTGAVDVPIFQGGRQKGRLAQADAELKRRAAAVEDLKASVYYDVRTSYLELESTKQQLEAATRGRELADQALQQSRDRFAAGVANNVEVILAQEAVAQAAERFISAQYGLSVARALLAQSTGSAEEAFLEAAKGSTP